MTQPPPVDLNSSEAIFAFASWLTTRKGEVAVGSNHDASAIAQLAHDFCAVNALPPIWDGWGERQVRIPAED